MAGKTIKDTLNTPDAEPELNPAPVSAPAPSVEQKANSEVLNAEVRRKKLLQTYRNEEKVPMYLSPMYRPYFGNVMTVGINGISIFFKVDGSIQHVPKTYADDITARRIAIDAMLTKQHKMADIANNHESSPGELELV
jgi:hypothetical protein